MVVSTVQFTGMATSSTASRRVAAAAGFLLEVFACRR
jgi:hypothetical protein